MVRGRYDRATCRNQPITCLTPSLMSALPFFCIVIPTFNRAGFIEGTLASVFAQKYERYEVIVVDNCSTDNTEEILEPYIKAQRIKFFRNDRNRERAYS